MDHWLSGPQSKHALEELREGGTIVVAKLARLGLSLGNLIGLVNELSKRDTSFKALDNPNTDTATSSSRLMLNIFGPLAENERELNVERTKTGLDAAKARGRGGGRRPFAADDPTVLRAKGLHDQGSMTPPEIAKACGTGVSTLYRYLAM